MRGLNAPCDAAAPAPPGGASGLSHSETRCPAFAGAGASSASTTCRFRESIPHPHPTAVYASDPALPRRPQDSLPSCLLGFGRTRLSLASSFQLSYRTPHPALGQDFTLARATPSAASEHLLELIGFPISRSFTTYCVCLELRSLPSTGVTRLPRCRVRGG